jgi:outer membrane protein OmpA-like peptidoglycan-associated protein
VSRRTFLDPDGLDGLFATADTVASGGSADHGKMPATTEDIPPANRFLPQMLVTGVVVACFVTVLLVVRQGLMRDAAVPADVAALQPEPTESSGTLRTQPPEMRPIEPGQIEAQEFPLNPEADDAAKALPPSVPSALPTETGAALVDRHQTPAEAATGGGEEISAAGAAASPVSPAPSDTGSELSPYIQRFRFNSVTLRHLTAAERSALVAFAKTCQGVIRIVGHACPVGPNEINRQVGLVRARAVRDLLRSEGMTDRTILIDSAGENQPVASNATARGRADNRRAEVFCLAGAVSPAQQGSPEGRARQ